MKLLHITVFIALIINGLSFTQAKDDDTLTIVHGPYIQNVSEHEATIVFATNKFVLPGVLIGTKELPARLVHNSHDGLFDVGEGMHKVKIKGLDPGTEYVYNLFACEIEDYKPYECVYGDTIISNPYRFVTREDHKDSIRFTVFCDLHDNPAKLSSYLNHNEIDRQDCYFLNGDIMGHLENGSQLYSSFLDTCVNRFATKIPFYYARGNHETRGQYARELKKFLDLPNDRYYYAFNEGPARFIVLDGGEDKPDSSKEYSGLVDFDAYRAEELEWLKKELSSDAFKSSAFKIVIIHMPIIRQERNWYGMAYLAEHFGPQLEKAGIDLMISGHLHRNIFIEPQNSGFGYPVLISSNNHFIEAKVNQHQLTTVLKDIEGNIIEQYVIHQKN